ncbi:hypothetical protein [Robertmurraya massiliosenegalensis]|uniref:hypothetical protein n=1 Tax=Robertmurraya massiliosenegalensis TaxID=1287657 RepID=UPI00030185D1|nr:hypothetical protein [Robertmurraya massiliosenegalensis]
MTNIIFETQQSFYEYINNVSNGSQEISDALREDRIGESLGMIIQFTEGVGWISQVISLMQEQNYFIDIDTSQIHEFLEEINDGLEIQDFIVVADMFEYEIQPFFEEAAKKSFNEIKDDEE